MLEKHLWNIFCCIWWFKFYSFLMKWSSFPEVLYKRGVLKNFLKFTDKHKKQSTRGVLLKGVLKVYRKTSLPQSSLPESRVGNLDVGLKFRRLYLFYKILRSKLRGCFFELVPGSSSSCASRGVLDGRILTFKIKTNFLKNSFFPAVMTEWNDLDIGVCNSSSCHIFGSLVLEFIGHGSRGVSSAQGFESLGLLTEVGLGLSHLAEHKFGYNFRDCLSPVCTCG